MPAEVQERQQELVALRVSAQLKLEQLGQAQVLELRVQQRRAEERRARPA